MRRILAIALCVMMMLTVPAMAEELTGQAKGFGGVVTVTDEIDAENEVCVSYPLHTLSAPQADENCVTVARNGVVMRIEPQKGDLVLKEITDRFGVDLNEGEPVEYHVSMPVQYHITYETERKKHHLLKVKYIITEGL